MTTLNKFFYEYEVQSVESYSTSIGQYLGSNQHNMETSTLAEKCLLFENPKNAELKQEFDNLSKNLVNPFTLMRHWLKYERLDLDAVFEAIGRRNELERKVRDAIAKSRED